MSFNTGLSGLNAASRNLDVIGHNIANANTTGMKAGRAEFAELYAASIGASGGTAGGIGVEVAAVSQLFSQGNITSTDVSANLEQYGQRVQITVVGPPLTAWRLPPAAAPATPRTARPARPASGRSKAPHPWAGSWGCR